MAGSTGGKGTTTTPFPNRSDGGGASGGNQAWRWHRSAQTLKDATGLQEKQGRGEGGLGLRPATVGRERAGGTG